MSSTQSPHPPRRQRSSGAPVVLHSVFDEYASRIDPSYVPLSQEVLKMLLYAQGATDDTLLEYQEINNNKWKAILGRCGGTLPSLGFKPDPYDSSVMYYDIPNSPLVIRIWSGGVHAYGQYCFDFFHLRNNVAVNTPDTYKIVYVPSSGVYTFGGELLSWEAAWGVRKEELRPREEKYSVPGGSRLALLRKRQEPFYFRIPTTSRGDISFAEPRAPGRLYE